MAKIPKHRPRMSRIDFFRLRSEALFSDCKNCIELDAGENADRNARWSKLTDVQKGTYAWSQFIGEVLNGGLVQYFYNCGDSFVKPICALVKVAGNSAISTI